MKQKPPFRNPAPIGSNTPSRRRADRRWADTELEHPACGAAPVWSGVDLAQDGSDRTTISTYEDGKLVRVEEWREQQHGSGMASFAVTAIGLAGCAALVAFCWWLGHGGKWAPLW